MDTTEFNQTDLHPTNPPVWKDFPLEDIYVDHAYQQPFDERWCDELVRNWDGNAAGALLVSVHSDGKAATPDGQHRIAAMRRKGITHWKCECHYGLTHAEEAALFLSRNHRKTVHSISKFRARVAMGEKEACEIKAILQNHGVQIAVQKPPTAPYYACVGNIEHAYADGVLDDTIRIIEECWGEYGKVARSQMVVEGVATFLRAYGFHNNFIMAKAIEKFSNPNNDPRKMRFMTLKQKAKSDADALGTSQSFQLAKSLREVYNKGGRTQVLPELRA